MINDKERLEIIQVIHDAIGWALNKDFDRLYSIMANDEDFFIFHPDSRSTIRGFEAFRQMAERVFRNDSFKATDYAVRDLLLNVSTSESCAWWSCMLDDHYKWDGVPGGWDNVRWTGTLEKRNDHWIIVQMHFSFPKEP
ncbi:MAG: hypothetical protein CVU42_09710 [Chloroflexi bacterium HGW-Chloroflexi-4]|jgi:ketosteroid isomerase-like protein|nr:MAG: hypothetical protein CVU42_09710 [Chloroflexi bacterium HGW-Chloroflexi-4]